MALPTTRVGSSSAAGWTRPPGHRFESAWLALAAVIFLCRPAVAAAQTYRLLRRATASPRSSSASNSGPPPAMPPGSKRWRLPRAPGSRSSPARSRHRSRRGSSCASAIRRPFGERGQRLVVEVFHERDIEGRLGTWQIDVVPTDAAGENWGIAAATQFSLVNGLYRLSLNTTKEYEVRNLVIHAPDLDLEMSTGMAYLAETPEGPTAVVLIGRGVMRFAPPDPAERTQLRIFSGSETLATDTPPRSSACVPGTSSRCSAPAHCCPSRRPRPT